jgi:hypothetical protein
MRAKRAPSASATLTFSPTSTSLSPCANLTRWVRRQSFTIFSHPSAAAFAAACYPYRQRRENLSRQATPSAPPQSSTGLVGFSDRCNSPEILASFSTVGMPSSILASTLTCLCRIWVSPQLLYPVIPYMQYHIDCILGIYGLV